MKNLTLITPLFLLLVMGCQKEPAVIVPEPEAPEIPETHTEEPMVFAVIGDYGHAGEPEQQVADMVKSWDPEYIITVGDNNYETGELTTMPVNITAYYGDYIYNPDAPAGYVTTGQASEDAVNRFFPAPGNHDAARGLDNYLSFFTLPGDELNYDFRKGPVHFFSLNSTANNYTATKTWLKNGLEQSDALYKVVYFHHPPFSSAYHGNAERMQWEFAAWGATVVLSGHEHAYERIINRETPELYYLVNGLGGRRGIHSCSSNPLNPEAFDVVCYNGNYGAMRVSATDLKMILSFYEISGGGTLVDQVVIER